MDPNANLQEQERIIARFHAETGDLNETTRNIIKTLSTDHERLQELRDALYDWLRSGGFEPDWSKAPQAACYFRIG